MQEILNKFFQFLQKEKMQKEEPVFAHLSKEEVDLLSPLVWAYIGDVVYELWVRLNVVSSQQSQVGKLHQESVKHVRAQAQASLLTDLEVFLTEEEKEIVRRGRNARPGSIPKNASVMTYRYSTAFESLIGYLFLTEQYYRLNEILDLADKILFAKS